ARLPKTQECGPDPARACSFLPLLFVNYSLPLDFHNQATAGTPLNAVFSVSAQQGAAAPVGVSATVSASFDDGQTWSSPEPAASRGGGRFSATIRQPPLAATNGYASLRVTVRDRTGDSVTQTTIRAYGLTS